MGLRFVDFGPRRRGRGLSKRDRRWSQVPIAVALLSTAVFPRIAVPGANDGVAEHLRYTISYQGIFSSFIPVEIAAAELTFSLSDKDTVNARLRVSSEAFRKTEVIYPFRFAYHSWIAAGTGRTLESVSLTRTRGKSEAERLRFDAQAGKIFRYQATQKTAASRRGFLEDAGAADTGLSAPLVFPEDPRKMRADPRWVADGFTSLPEDLEPWDRLAMLQWLRTQPLRPGLVLQPPAFNGKSLRGYRIEVEDRELLQLDGRARAAYRLRFEAEYDEPEERARPVLVWLSADERRLPLRFVSERSFGRLEVKLSNG